MFLAFFALFWFAALGSVIGSFLNVVIYRLPLGMSLSFPGSHCPKCKHAIRWYDNVPVLGWLRLRGKCRDCGASIHLRYPLIEAITGLVYTAMAFCAFFRTSGLSLEQSCGLSLYLSVLFTTLLAAGMIQWDGKIVPIKLFLPLVFIVVACSLPFPFLHPLAYFHFSPECVPRPSRSWYELWGSGVTAALGGAFAAAIAPSSFPLLKKEQRPGWCVAVICTGAFLGWQCVLLGTAATLVSFLVTKPLKLRPIPILVFTASTFTLVIVYYFSGFPNPGLQP